MRKTGLSQPADITAKNFENYRTAGIDCLEISPREHEYDTLDINNIKKLADEFNIELQSFHLRFAPFDKYDISNTDETLRLFAVDYHKKFIKDCSAVGIKIFVIHASGEPIDDSNRKQKLELSKKSLCELAEYADTFEAVIAVEDLPRTCLGNCSSELLDIISCDSRLKICFDTNHMLFEDLSSFLRSVSLKLVTTHFSDYDFIDERHWLPGEGDIDWNELMNTFDEIGYNGPVLYELGYKAPKTLTRPRDLTPSDFKLNHTELENRRKLTVIGNRIPNYMKL